MKYPNWREAPPYVNVATTEDVVLSRMQVVALQRDFALEVQQRQRDAGVPVLYPCNWCGQPSGDWCESCVEAHPGPAHALCTSCEAQWMECRLCRLEHKLQGSRSGTAHRIRGGAWLGSNLCGGRNQQHFDMKICKSCRLIRYCSQECQTKHWKGHKPLCRFFSELQPLTIVYPWYEERAVQVTQGHEILFPPVRFRGMAVA